MLDDETAQQLAEWYVWLEERRDAIAMLLTALLVAYVVLL